MGMNKAGIRRKRTAMIGTLRPNGHKGRSQKGCFGGKVKPIGKTIEVQKNEN
jgi:hypothetical protein